ncbi:MAG TPA: class I SAM-dependent methyltransferase [Candidatus Nanoarchaeia archaeon]|nr:class I SAM-dependent methyltransferase [Candidatus Nanoarchaeia archaeon]
MKNQLMYKEYAKYYDLIYSWKNYKKEADKINKLINFYKKSNGLDLLEVACGTAHHLKYLKNKFNCSGIDINQGILDVAKKKFPDINFKKADMVNFKFGKKFDIITCLFSSIGYVKTEANLRKTINNFASHLKQGGVVIIEPWFTKSAYRVGFPHMTTYESKELKIARLNVSKVKGNLSIMDMHFLVAEKDKEMKYFIDRHEMGMFGTDKISQIMKEAGLKAKFLKKGFMEERGLFVGIKE